MPNRIIKESICTSDSIDALSWFEECLFYRLIVNCDDFGRFDGRAAIIKNRLFPLKENLTIKAVEAAVQRLANIGLVVLYVFEDKPYLYLRTWDEHQTIRAKKSKYPDPKPESICMQLQADECKCSRNPIQSESESESKHARGAKGENRPDLSRFSPFVGKTVENWLSYKAEKRQSYKGTGLEMLLNKIEKQVSLYGETAVVELIEESMANNWQGIAWGKLEKSTPKRLRPEDIEL